MGINLWGWNRYAYNLRINRHDGAKYAELMILLLCLLYLVTYFHLTMKNIERAITPQKYPGIIVYETFSLIMSRYSTSLHFTLLHFTLLSLR